MSPVLYKSQSPCQVGRGTVKIIEEDFRSFGQTSIRTTSPRFPVTFTHLHTNSYSFMLGLFMRPISYSFELRVSVFEKLSAFNLTFAVAVKSMYQMQWPVKSVFA